MTDGTSGKRSTMWLRGVSSVLVGYVLWAFGLMGIVSFLFLSGREFPGLVIIGADALGTAALAVVVATLTKRIAGPARRPATVALAMVVLAVGFLNVALGVAVEPPWFTFTAVTIGAAGIWWLGRR